MPLTLLCFTRYYQCLAQENALESLFISLIWLFKGHSKDKASEKLVFLTLDSHCISSEKMYSPAEHCSFWALDPVVVQWEGTREMCHHMFEDHIQQIIPFPEFSDCLVIGFAPMSSSALSLMPLVVGLAPSSSYKILQFCQLQSH